MKRSLRGFGATRGRSKDGMLIPIRNHPQVEDSQLFADTMKHVESLRWLAMPMRFRFLPFLLFSVLALPGVLGAVLSADDFEDSTLVLALPAVFTGSNLGATLQPGELRPCANIHSTVWYTLAPTVPTTVTASTVGSSFDTVLAVYTGNALGGLTLVDCNDDSIGLASQVVFSVTPGTTYQIQLGSYSGADQGSFMLELTAADVQTTGSDLRLGLVCFPHNPGALTNACVGIEPKSSSAPFPTVTPGAGICIIGNVCAPSVGIGSTVVDHPGADGYVEATAACPLSVPCRITLP